MKLNGKEVYELQVQQFEAHVNRVEIEFDRYINEYDLSELGCKLLLDVPDMLIANEDEQLKTVTEEDTIKCIWQPNELATWEEGWKRFQIAFYREDGLAAYSKEFELQVNPSLGEIENVIYAAGFTMLQQVINKLTDGTKNLDDAVKEAERWAHGLDEVEESKTDNAKFYKEKAEEAKQKAEEERKKVEELVKMTSGIEEQVEQVKEYKEQAATAATNATIYEQAAKTAKDAAIQAQMAAETAEDAAEQHAIAAAGDKAEVERMAGQVATDKQTVAQDKADVEKKVSDFELTAQQAVADVNNAGQEQVERVQGAGDTDIQEVNTAKDTAVKAINSAKDAAVQSITTTGQEQVVAVQEEGKRVLESIPEDYQTAMAGKVDKQQGAENAGKVLGINQDGNVVPVEQTGGGIDFDKISKLLIKPQTEQAELLKINDSADFPVLELSGQGWTEQDSTTGAQLFYDKNVVLLVDANSPDEVVTDGNKTTFKRKIGTYNQFAIRIKIEPNKIGEYKVSVKNIQIKKTHSETFENGSFLQIYVYKNGSQIGVGNRNFLINVDDISAKYEVELRFVNENNEFTSYDALIAELMIAEKTVTKYEEYTGNKPSPSPEYPQEIQNSGKINEETQKYEGTVRVSNKNMFDKNFAENKENWTAGINYPYMPVWVGKGNKICVSYKKELQKGLGFYACVSKTSGSSSDVYGWLYHSTAETLIKKILTFTAEEDYIFLSTSGANVDTQKFMENIGNDLQIEISESPTAYVEHDEQSVTITSDRPVSKWDRLECRNGVYGWVYKTMIGKLNGDEEWNMYNDTGTQVFRTTLDPFVMQDDGYMDSFLLADNRPVENNYCFARSFYYGEYTIAIRHDETSTLEEFKRFLKENNVQYVFEGIEEKFVPLPEEEQAALKALLTYYPSTIATTDTGLLLQMNYVADPDNYIQNNYEPKTELEEIKKRVLTLEKEVLKQK